jgi:hypothetical protein
MESDQLILSPRGSQLGGMCSPGTIPLSGCTRTCNVGLAGGGGTGRLSHRHASLHGLDRGGPGPCRAGNGNDMRGALR